MTYKRNIIINKNVNVNNKPNVNLNLKTLCPIKQITTHTTQEYITKKIRFCRKAHLNIYCPIRVTNGGNHSSQLF